MHISIRGFSPETSEQEIRQALEDFGVQVNSITYKTDEASGSVPLAIVDVETDQLGAKVLAEHIDGRFWKGKKLRARSYLFLENDA